MFDHLGSAGACHHCTQLQSLVLERAKKNVTAGVPLMLHFKTHIPIMADVWANIVTAGVALILHFITHIPMAIRGKYWERGKT